MAAATGEFIGQTEISIWYRRRPIVDQIRLELFVLFVSLMSAGTPVRNNL